MRGYNHFPIIFPDKFGLTIAITSDDLDHSCSPRWHEVLINVHEHAIVLGYFQSTNANKRVTSDAIT